MLSRAKLTQNEAVSDAELVRGALAREPAAFRALMTRHNQRLYRLARSILRSDAEAEDALQDAYLHAFAGLSNFRGDSALSTWLSRIVVNEALGRLRKWRKARTEPLPPDRPMADIIPFPGNASSDDPERTMAQRQIVAFVEAAADELPDAFDVVQRRVVTAKSESKGIVIGLDNLRADTPGDETGQTDTASKLQQALAGEQWIVIDTWNRRRSAISVSMATAAGRPDFPERVLWGTDWPHPHHAGPVPDDGALVDMIAEIAPTEALRRGLMVDNPARLYDRATR